MNDARRKCDSLEAQLTQLRDMAKQSSVQQLSEQVFPFVQFFFFTISDSLFDRPQLGRRLKCVFSGEPSSESDVSPSP